MHEAGIARAVAAAMREQHLAPESVVLRIRGGDGDPDAVDAAVRLHLALIVGAAAAKALVIERAAAARVCAACARAFEAILPDEPCPACGGPGMTVAAREEIELVVAPPSGDRGALQTATASRIRDTRDAGEDTVRRGPAAGPLVIGEHGGEG